MKTILLSVVMLSVCGWTVTAADQVEILYVSQSKGIGNQVDVVGEISNGCPDAVQVKMRVTARDGNGVVMATTIFYPASTRRIAAHATYPFDYFVCLKPDQNYEQVGKVEVTIDEVTE